MQSVRHGISDSGLPKLTGLAGEVELAADVRLDILIQADIVIGRLNCSAASGSRRRATLDQAIRGSRRLRCETPAAWWIEHRNADVAALLGELGESAHVIDNQAN